MIEDQDDAGNDSDGSLSLEFSGRSRYLAAQLAGNLLRTIDDNLPAQ